VRAHLPERVRNSRGELFGGFGPVYVDFVAIAVLRAGEHAGPARSRFATVNMRVDYFEPVVGPAFEIESRIVKRRGRTALVETHVLDRGEIAIFALTTVREFAEEKEA
jgi:acyl-coenzyme A thioesterase PaaI-like protein